MTHLLFKLAYINFIINFGGRMFANGRYVLLSIPLQPRSLWCFSEKFDIYAEGKLEMSSDKVTEENYFAMY